MICIENIRLACGFSTLVDSLNLSMRFGLRKDSTENRKWISKTLENKRLKGLRTGRPNLAWFSQLSPSNWWPYVWIGGADGSFCAVASFVILGCMEGQVLSPEAVQCVRVEEDGYQRLPSMERSPSPTTINPCAFFLLGSIACNPISFWFWWVSVLKFLHYTSRFSL